MAYHAWRTTHAMHMHTPCVGYHAWRVPGMHRTCLQLGREGASFGEEQRGAHRGHQRRGQRRAAPCRPKAEVDAPRVEAECLLQQALEPPCAERRERGDSMLHLGRLHLAG